MVLSAAPSRYVKQQLEQLLHLEADSLQMKDQWDESAL